jgi:foldase protein PrsA
VALFVCALPAILSGCGKKDVAVVNGTRISHEEFVSQLGRDYGHEVLSRMIDRMLVDQAFEKAALKFPQEKLESVIQEWRDQAGSEEEFQRGLAMQGRTEQDLRDAIEMGIKVEMLGQKDLNYTDADLKKYYQENQLRYDEPEKVAFSEIVVQSQKEADDIYEMAKKADAKFPDLAKQYSIAPTRARGGQRPLLSKEEIIPLEARDRAFALSKGEVSKPFKGAEQWMIIKLDDHRPAKKLTFEEARDRVEEDYKREQMVQPADLIQQLRNSAQVRIADPQFIDLQPMYMGTRLLDQVPGGPPGEGTPPAGTPAPPTEGPPPTPSQPPAEPPQTGGKGGS